MKKYFVRDGKDEYEVSEYANDEEIITNPETEPKHDAEILSDDEIAGLRELIELLPALKTLVESASTTEDNDEDDPGLKTCDEDEDEIDNDEVVVETEKRACDSKKSFGANTKRKPTIDDSLVDDVSAAWAKRYGGI